MVSFCFAKLNTFYIGVLFGLRRTGLTHTSRVVPRFADGRWTFETNLLLHP